MNSRIDWRTAGDRARAVIYDEEMRLIRRLLDVLSRDKLVADVGAGDGRILKELAGRGFEKVYAIEKDENRAMFLREHFRYPVYCCDVRDMRVVCDVAFMLLMSVYFKKDELIRLLKTMDADMIVMDFQLARSVPQAIINLRGWSRAFCYEVDEIHEVAEASGWEVAWMKTIGLMYPVSVRRNWKVGILPEKICRLLNRLTPEKFNYAVYVLVVMRRKRK